MLRDKYYEGTEACPNCGMEIDYKINPYKSISVSCPHCGYKEAIICSLCDQPYGCNTGCDKKHCKRSILETLEREYGSLNRYTFNVSCRFDIYANTEDEARDIMEKKLENMEAYYVETEIVKPKYTSFIDDKEKMYDFFLLSKEDFLNSYSYLTEEEYELTKQEVAQKLLNVISEK